MNSIQQMNFLEQLLNSGEKKTSLMNEEFQTSRMANQLVSSVASQVLHMIVNAGKYVKIGRGQYHLQHDLEVPHQQNEQGQPSCCKKGKTSSWRRKKRSRSEDVWWWNLDNIDCLPEKRISLSDEFWERNFLFLESQSDVQNCGCVEFCHHEFPSTFVLVTRKFG